MKSLYTFLFLLYFILPSISSANEIGFEEKFGLAEDRSEALKQLIPGTEDYYFYHSLHYLNTKQYGKVDKFLNQWIKRRGYTGKVKEIQNRRAILLYEKEPEKALAFIKERLDLKFNHQKEVLDKKTHHPITLNQDLISVARLSQRAFKRYRGLQGFEDAALEFLANKNINAVRRREVLSRIKRPDIPGLPQLVIADLKHKHSSGFGSLGIHKSLLLSQLDECLSLMPGLLDNTNFINTYINKLHPPSGVDFENNHREKEAYLVRLWSFVKRLSAARNSLKAHILYNRLKHDMSLGIYNKARFMEYIKLPKNVFYMNPKYLRSTGNFRFQANLTTDFRNITSLPAVNNDRLLIHDYLSRFFLREDSWKPYLPYIEDNFLKQIFAETKILNGLGDPERWFSMLATEKYLALKERVDIDFSPANKTIFPAKGLVRLKSYIKNVKKLIVKIYDINTFNYYRDKKREIDLSINLDGLIPNEEKVFNYNEIPLRRVLRTFDFPALRKQGVYIVEFIGNGKSSRALIKKGRLKYLESSSTAGHLFTILDDENNKMLNGSIWLDGHYYKAGKDGNILVPFTNKPGRQAFILNNGDFSSLDTFEHASENYLLGGRDLC